MSESYKPLRGSSAPAHSILNPAFRYTPAAATDLRARFTAMRLKQARLREALDGGKKVIELRKVPT